MLAGLAETTIAALVHAVIEKLTALSGATAEVPSDSNAADGEPRLKT